ncbi:DNA-3-methyladenine glycosylase family protein [Bacillus sp. CGMCC 1.16607]|uniref:DNA-3-methyladenine glycosylase family protein n=1 Tax=Bacillus sp. CGMCC 1.16607 TaxID=3351842 RepID=UPI00363D5EA4
MKWIDLGASIEIYPPKEFNFQECLVFLGRSQLEILHQIRDGYLYKLVKLDEEMILLKIGNNHHSIQVEFPMHKPSTSVREKVAAYIWEWFDLNQRLSGFYEVANNDAILKQMANKYYGLRIICIPDLFEALTWAIMGQQINLSFAYTLKKRFVEQFGECLTFEGENYWIYPTAEKIAILEVEDLRKLQITFRKAEYIIGVAKTMANGNISKELLQQEPNIQSVQNSLTAIRGVGAWTADYVRMKCLHDPTAFPIADVGLHQALKLQLGLEQKPTIEEIRDIAVNWEGWQAYATFYLWRSLYE